MNGHCAWNEKCIWADSWIEKFKNKNKNSAKVNISILHTTARNKKICSELIYFTIITTFHDIS